MGRPTDWHVLDFDKDPTPGDPTQVDVLARRLKDFADDVGDALRSVKGLKGDSAVQSWTGLAGDEYRSQFDGIPGELEKLERSYRMCGDALATYWPKLQQAQGDADRALEQGRQAKADLATAQNSLDSANDWVKRANDQAKKYQDDPKPGAEPPSDADVKAASRNATNASGAQRDASAAVDSAQGRLDAAKQLAADARKLREDEAGKAKNAIDDASDAGIQNKKWYEKAVDWVIDHWDEIVAVCKIVVAVLGVIVMIIGGPLAWIVLAAALVVLADTLIKYSQGKASLWDVAFAALDCIPGFKGLTTAGGLLKLAKGGLKGMKGSLDNVAGALRRGGKGPRETSVPMDNRVCKTDPVDVVTGDMVLPQTDVRLPGALPLVLGRAHLSSYRDGRWFGRSWTSTVDQRLEIDDQGVVFVTDDGMLLFYPVPVPDAPTLPVEGPRWPLTWDGTPGGEIRISKPETGHTLHFDPDGPKLPGGPGHAMELPLRALTDRADRRIDFDYSDEGQLAGIRHGDRYRLGVETADGRITAIRFPDSEEDLVRYAYDADGNLTEVINSSGLPLRFRYDTRGRVTGWHDRNGTDYGYTYNEDGRCVRTTGSDGFLSGAFAYDAENRATVYTDSMGFTTRLEFNEALQVVRETDPLGAVTVCTWDRFDRLLSRTDPLGRTTTFVYDADGNLVSVTRPDGARSTAEYNDLRLPVSVTHTDGTRWEQEWDEQGRLLATTAPDGGTTRHTYGDDGRLTGVTDALGETVRIEMDAAELVVSLTDPLGGTSRYDRDALGRVIAITDPVGGVTRVGWTPEGRPAWRTLPDGSTERWSYDGEGSLVEHVDPAGGVTRFDSTHFELRSARTAPDGSRLEFSYDTELRLTSVANEQGLNWNYEYDPAGRLIRETDFNDRTLSYRYDLAGQLVERTNGAGETTRYTRDLAGNVVERRAGDRVTTLAYDKAGRVLHAVNDDAELVFERDVRGRTLAETCNGRTLTNEYDALGRRTRRRTPGGAVSEWEWSATSRPTALRTAGQTVDFVHDAAGRETGRGLGAAARLRQEWDALHRVTAQTLEADPAGAVGATGVGGTGLGGTGIALEAPEQAGGARLLRRRTYAYRADGYVTGVDDSALGSRSFDLDPVGRVLTVQAREWTESYAYDSAGNLTHSAGPEGTSEDTRGERTYSGTLVRRAGRTRYEHDEQGRVVRHTVKLLSGGSRSWHYTWGADDRLTAVVTPDGSRWTYLYDALGRRIEKRRTADDGTTVLERTTFTWDGTRLAEQTHDGLTTTWDWAPRTHTAVSQTERETPVDGASQDEVDARFYAIVTDLVGTPTELVAEDGSIAWQSRTTLWGAPVAPTDGGGGGSPGDPGTDCPLRFPGQYHDDETGLHYNVFRYYAPDTAGYLSPDPLGLAPGPNHHAYILNPLVWTDPLGLSGCQRTRAEAREQALRDAGVPEGQAPLEVREYVPATTSESQGSRQIMDEDHNPVYFREEDHLTESGDLITYQDHHTGHRQPGEDGYQPPHVHVRPYDNPRTGQLPGCEEHYYYDPDLG